MEAGSRPQPHPDPENPTTVPTPLILAAVLVLIEGLAAAAYGVAEFAHLSGARATMAVTTGLFFVIVGLGLALCAWGLRRARSLARGPVLLAQLMGLGLAWNFRTGSTWPAAVALAVPAVIVLVGMLHPATIEALEGPHDPS